MTAHAVSPRAINIVTVGKSYLARATVLAARGIGLIGLAVSVYLMAMFAAGWAMPRLMGMVASGMGIDLEAITMSGFGAWLMGSAVLVLLLTALVLVATRGLWRVYSTLIARLRSRLGTDVK